MNKILVLNSGSSSLKFQLYDEEKVLVKGIVDAIGLSTCEFRYIIGDEKEVSKKSSIKDHVEAVSAALDAIGKVYPRYEISAIGHRVVHGGEKYKDSVKITDEVINEIERLCELAPLHNPPNLKGILACKQILPGAPQVAVFDTSFHQTIPKKAYLYGIPYEYYTKYGIRKYGFHGTSHKYVMQKALEVLGKKKANIITCHLGNGSSICAIKNNESVDTTMGFTPLQGLMMGTRSGDIDPAIVAFIAEKEKIDAEKVISILNKKAGLLGIDGYSDVRTIHEKAVAGDERCQLGLQMFAYHVVEYIGAYIAVLGKVDAIVFTAGIGCGAYYLREVICSQLEFEGITLDIVKNNENKETVVSAPNSKIKILVIPTNEELMIAKDTKKVLGME